MDGGDGRLWPRTGSGTGISATERFANINVEPGDRIIARSITFSSSRTLPGQSYRVSSLHQLAGNALDRLAQTPAVCGR